MLSIGILGDEICDARFVEVQWPYLIKKFLFSACSIRQKNKTAFHMLLSYVKQHMLKEDRESISLAHNSPDSGAIIETHRVTIRMGYIIPCRGKRRRIVCSDEDAKKEDGNTNTTHQSNTNTDEQRNRAESVASTAATNPESDTDEDEDPLAEEATQLQNEIVLKKLQRVNGEGDEVQLLHTSSRAKLFEYVKGGEDNDEGTWAYRGEGQVKFIRCLEEGYNRGMIRMELTKNCTLEILMCHEVTHEDVSFFHPNVPKSAL